MDGWWSGDYARQVCAKAESYLQANAALISSLGCDAITVCPEMTSQVAACASDPGLQARQFENELAADFAPEPLCHGLRFDSFSLPDDRAAKEYKDLSNWVLMVNFQPGAERQAWNVARGFQALNYVEGTSTPKEMAAKVCAIVTQRGAQLVN